MILNKNETWISYNNLRSKGKDVSTDMIGDFSS